MRNVLRSFLMLALLSAPMALYAASAHTQRAHASSHAHHATRHHASKHHVTKAKRVSSTSSPYALTDDTQCLTMAIYREARGESEAGMAGVGYVVMNRVGHQRFPPKSVCGVVKQAHTYKSGKRACQFSWVCHAPKGKINAASYARAKRVAEQVLAGTIANPVGSSLYFHERRVSRGSPSRYATHRIALGNHVFFGPKPTRAAILAASRPSHPPFST